MTTFKEKTRHQFKTEKQHDFVYRQKKGIRSKHKKLKGYLKAGYIQSHPLYTRKN